MTGLRDANIRHGMNQRRDRVVGLPTLVAQLPAQSPQRAPSRHGHRVLRTDRPTSLTATPFLQTTRLGCATQSSIWSRAVTGASATSATSRPSPRQPHAMRVTSRSWQPRACHFDERLIRLDLRGIESSESALTEMFAWAQPPTALFTAQNLITIGVQPQPSQCAVSPTRLITRALARSGVTGARER